VQNEGVFEQVPVTQYLEQQSAWVSHEFPEVLQIGFRG